MSLLTFVRVKAEITSVFNNTEITSTYTLSDFPRNLQFFARDSQDSAEVKYSGSVNLTGYDSVYMEVYKNTSLWKRKSSKLIYTNGFAMFDLRQKIHSELSEYHFKLYLRSGPSSLQISKADSIVCGDFYLIGGQSNAHATDPLMTYSNEYCRSFGVQTPNYNGYPYNPSDTLWGISKADGAVRTFSGPFNVGVWGLELQKLIKENFGIPTCIINGGAASSTIELNLRNNNNPADLNTLYGRQLYRTQKALLTDKVKAIFWFQGESNGNETWVNYAQNFRTLYDQWKENYPGFRYTYVFQVRPCCSAQFASQLREVQRELPNSFQNLDVIATAGLPYYSGCHYQYLGYKNIASVVFRPVSKRFYSPVDTTGMTGPNVRSVFYTNSQKNEIAILFNYSTVSYWPQDTLGQSMKDYFYLNGQTGLVSYGYKSGDTIKLRLTGTSNATKLTYLPTVWTHIDSAVYLGPFLRNSRGVGAYSFFEFPISDNPLTYFNFKATVEGLYNIVSGKLNLSDTVRLYIRNNFFPYQIKDSAVTTLDSINFTCSFSSSKISSGYYYYEIKGKNSIETWSSNGGTYISAGNVNNYDFTVSASRAYGNNLKYINGLYCIYGGDVNSDGSIDLNDMYLIDNDVQNVRIGYYNTDIDRDRIVDLSDLLVADNNGYNFITKIVP
ncbi:MAG: hypothetical protein JSS91_09040 [Bacteroidetes bacterium]|nr:hypothetical protein [Bacteroidota bacterium]